MALTTRLSTLFILAAGSSLVAHCAPSNEPCTVSDGGGCNGGRSIAVDGCMDESTGSPSESSGSESTEAEPICGNGIVEDGEDCDDDNKIDGDGCSAECQAEAGPVCGDGQCDPDEQECPADCGGVCGDGTQDEGEQCDDGNDDVNDGCVECKSATCGDGHPQANVEACDDANDDDTDDCVQCQLAACGDGFVQNGVEACDDGAENSDAYGTAAHCNASCTGTASYCGDEVVDAEEECEGTLAEGCLTNTCKLGKSCVDVVGESSGIFRIYPKNASPEVQATGVEVWCELGADGGGYTFLKWDASPQLTSAAQAETVCATYGMQLWLPRSQGHIEASWAVATGAQLLPVTGGLDASPDYMGLAGIYAKQSGVSCVDADSLEGMALNSQDCPAWGTKDGTPYFVSAVPGKQISPPLTFEPGAVNCTDCSMYYSWTAPGLIESYKAINGGSASLRFMCDLGDKLP